MARAAIAREADSEKLRFGHSDRAGFVIGWPKRPVSVEERVDEVRNAEVCIGWKPKNNHRGRNRMPGGMFRFGG